MQKKNKQNIQSNTRVSREWLIEVASESIEHAAWPINWSEKQTISIYGSPKKYRIFYESIGSHYVPTHSRTKRFNAMHQEKGASAFVPIYHEEVKLVEGNRDFSTIHLDCQVISQLLNNDIP